MTRRPTISTRPATLVPYTTLFRAFDRPEVSGLFNVGTGQARSFADLAAALFAALDRAPRIDYVDMPAPLRGRYQYFTEARMERLRRSEEHTSELQSLMRTSYAVFCLKKKKTTK